MSEETAPTEDYSPPPRPNSSKETTHARAFLVVLTCKGDASSLRRLSLLFSELYVNAAPGWGLILREESWMPFCGPWWSIYVISGTF